MRYLPLDRLGRFSGVCGLPDRASDDDVIGAGPECLLDGHGSLLIVTGCFIGCADAGGDDDWFGSKFGAKTGRLLAGTD